MLSCFGNFNYRNGNYIYFFCNYNSVTLKNCDAIFQLIV